MMRSLYAGVAGLKTHQTRMDVIGNNIANVNTTAYKSQSMTFSDLMYQTTQHPVPMQQPVSVVRMHVRSVLDPRPVRLKPQLPSRVQHRQRTIRLT